jgi:hypothetical protein
LGTKGDETGNVGEIKQEMGDEEINREGKELN